LDGAHNPAAARTLAGMLPGLGYRRVVVVVGVMEDKDVAGVLKPLLAAADQAVLTRPRYHRAASVDALAAAAGDFRGPVETATPIEKAVETAYQRAEAQDLVVVTGSLFTAGEARAYLTRDQTSVLTG
jgi:dihydrofolate synthase/folylpolyglutamate synthase